MSMTRRKKLILAALYITLPLIIGWIGYSVYAYNLPHHGHLFANGKETAYYDLPRISLGNIPGMGHSHTMKIALSLEVPADQYQRIEDFEPRIIEKILLFMHDQKPEDLERADGQQRLRESLKDTISHGAVPIKVVSVAIREMVVE
jgi:flagellar basal body-associated protein FliL